MKTFKLWVHQKTSFSGDELVLNPKEFPQVTIGSVVQIYHPEEDSNRLLLQVTTHKDDFQQKETISIEQSVASAFQLRTYQDVIVNIVQPHNVSLDLIELCFKDQYFSRSDMWRLARTLSGKCVYQGKKVAYSEMRANVSEIWAKGERMTCGFITDDTKVVFRSSTAVINIFIQMSHEMWEFDAVGDLYFEKASEFLKALFAKWSEKNCCHDVTIVMFSRTFYIAQSRDDFPLCMRDCVQEDYMGRYYEDFYRVVVQNERFDEWTSIIIELKKLFVGYRARVLKGLGSCGHEGAHLECYNSAAAQGNFLEVINMSLNVYENFNIDRNFDRTGKIAMVITPGAGVFEVNRELTNVTKQRTIDNGIGMDIVCMAEQPLHVVPLFKFHSKTDPLSFEVGDDYNLPHWINISFYQSTSQLQSSNASSFVPRTKFGLKMSKASGAGDLSYLSSTWSTIGEHAISSGNFPFMDFDEYDAQVFKVPKNLGSLRNGRRANSASKPRTSQTVADAIVRQAARVRTISDDFCGLPIIGRSTDPASPVKSTRLVSEESSLDHMRSVSQESLLDSETDSAGRFIVGSDSSLGNKYIRSRKLESNSRLARALINPFAPARMNFKVTSNRRRWIHAFPIDPKGSTIRQHCYHQKDQETKCERQPPPIVVEAAQLAVEARKHRTRLESGSDQDPPYSPTPTLTRSSSGATICQNTATSFSCPLNSSSSNVTRKSADAVCSTKRSSASSTSRRMQKIKKDWKDFETKPGGWFFGPTGESEWSPSLTLGVDWKSLCVPAHLPITTDYFPDDETLKKYCLFPAYSLIPYDIYPEINLDIYNKGVDPCAHMFSELVSQRLAQGFQLISEDRMIHAPMRYLNQTPRIQQEEVLQEYKLSIGRIFHCLTFNGKEIKVTRYNPMHAVKPIDISYRYKLQVPDAEVYEPCVTTFANQQLEKFNWNYLDHYICSLGQGDYGLLESFKFWRSRFFLLPAVNSATKKILEGFDRCDIYEDRSNDEIRQLDSGFLRFIEALNKIRRPAPSRKPQQKRITIPSVRKPIHAQDTNDIKPERGRVRHPSVPAKLQTEGFENKPSPVESRRFSGTTSALVTQNSVDTSMQVGESGVSSANMLNTLNHNSSLSDIIGVMMDAMDGLSFLPSQPGLPSNCFVGSEAVTWVECCMKGIGTTDEAVELLQRMIDNKLICHASGDFRRKFQPGFVLYTIVTDHDFQNADRESVIKFHNDWCEVELDRHQYTTSGPIPDFLLPSHEITVMNLWRKVLNIDSYRQVSVDVDPNNRSDRKEWAVAQYHTMYNANSPFSLEIQWMVATGCILGDLIYSYSRKASSCGYHLLPVPVDQFALPQSKMADPLRVPVFIPLKVSCLKTDPDVGIFDGFSFDPIDHLRRLQLFQHAILKRFGFLHDFYSVNVSTSFGLAQDTPLKYVHCSGSIFVLIPDYPAQQVELTRHNSGENKPRRKCSIHSEFVTRHGIHDHGDQHAGFLWAWNFMLSKRWRTINTGDEVFQDKMLSDFRKFCSNDENRLKQFWDECWGRLRKHTGLVEESFSDVSAED